ncbi:23S rRNA (adenine(2503)-C(2))-methyltransferase RlmN [Candidatus Peregrinibacteria bacterium]|jgi:23S rRNA (adenine2503-C2)-methyltransferase|nr:23S rRNA (adenine(2503)-C(2))-methyltransferase RlmN [Candidatus Peregrinibacteria bacterium]MBT3598383.1 23S rRNA (adenine(2503)-C(2))-methyltransferase RlmN [Candidatus Peregrinibacteria bacterium]MBT4367420.1 23S rRNA (adenine(2503)-C(2))-methyltransferase RlmN [Candidatus Peregrinibacteria bacterium]MBT4585690.1 23S rRNA (adenine(2503)-C(2))-methyltransferase RlmN [Candidatus Peregrinibacteria bacterium]MBT6730420.1 23S rRNA (adenine(2503)-C(2))-methyltransferase RlmN [Candidatus Peregri
MTAAPLNRHDHFKKLFPKEPKFRIKQIEKAYFTQSMKGWDDVTTLGKEMRSVLTKEIPWISCKSVSVLSSKTGDTHKAVLEGLDGELFETVLMANNRDQWTICVSSQIGCAMGCVFCATGAMGLKRDLSSDEIADQFRFWRQFLLDRPELNQRISNVVFMGMGEPLVNIENVKAAIKTWLDYTDIGPTRITVSTVGVLPVLQEILTDPDWPAVRIAISLHSPEEESRRKIVPTTAPKFHEKLARWTRDYQGVLGNRRHHITFEYTLIAGVNDNAQEAKELVKFVKRCGEAKVNVIPLNPVMGKEFSASSRQGIEEFKKVLLDSNIDVTERKTMGQDIAAACGQLALKIKKDGEVVG